MSVKQTNEWKIPLGITVFFIAICIIIFFLCFGLLILEFAGFFACGVWVGWMDCREKFLPENLLEKILRENLLEKILRENLLEKILRENLLEKIPSRKIPWKKAARKNPSETPSNNLIIQRKIILTTSTNK
jgi:hypothetical protein